MKIEDPKLRETAIKQASVNIPYFVAIGLRPNDKFFCGLKPPDFCEPRVMEVAMNMGYAVLGLKIGEGESVIASEKISPEQIKYMYENCPIRVAFSARNN